MATDRAAPRERETVLVVDDDPAIQRALRAALEARNYRVLLASGGKQAIDVMAAGAPRPDVILLDLGLPDVDGVDVCERIRDWSDVPIVVLSAEGSEGRKVRALDVGADDYVTKPFSMPELLARLRVALRHRRSDVADPEAAVLVVGDITVDIARHVVLERGREVDLTPKEFDFLALLARFPGRVLTHKTILQAVWGPQYESETQYLRVYASQLRKKLDEDPAAPRLITAPGVGYRLVSVSDGDASDGSPFAPT